jgi:drug/metabolite transporter (DMT)-like permease
MEINPLVFALPAGLDVCGSVLNFAGLSILTTSNYQMLKILAILYVVSFSTLIGSRYSCHQWIALVLVVGGMVTISVRDMTTVEHSVTVGIAFMVVGQAFHGA